MYASGGIDMPRVSAAIAASVFMLFTGHAPAADPLAVGRQMLMEDNPGELWIDQGKKLFFDRRGPKSVSLEQCDFGLGPASSKALR